MLKLAAAIATASAKALSEDGKVLPKVGASNQGFHYYGFAKFFGQADKAFAEALVNLKKSLGAGDCFQPYGKNRESFDLHGYPTDWFYKPQDPHHHVWLLCSPMLTTVP